MPDLCHTLAGLCKRRNFRARSVFIKHKNKLSSKKNTFLPPKKIFFFKPKSEVNERKEKGKKNGRKAIFFLLRFFSVPKTVELCGPISLAWKLIDSKNKPLFHRHTHLCGEVIQFFNARGGPFFFLRQVGSPEMDFFTLRMFYDLEKNAGIGGA